MHGARIWELDQTTTPTGLTVPTVLFKLCSFFTTFKQLRQCEGIFRQSCGESKRNKLIFYMTFKEYNCLLPKNEEAGEGDVDFKAKRPNISRLKEKEESFAKEPHSVANVIKIFLREMDEPLCQSELYEEFYAASTCNNVAQMV
jgi:hypothetical protein